jgi:protocatechuate 3,4-dioxygenase beta subunit
MPEVTAGPYRIPSHLTRRNITERNPGLAVALQITVLHANRCIAARNADVEVWQADALERYPTGGSRISCSTRLRETPVP